MRKLAFLLASTLLFTFFASAQTILVPYNSVWKYLDNGSNQNTAWRESTFNDATWKTGPAQLGYGQGDEATIVSYGPDSDKRYLTTYFRKTISIANAADYTNFTLNVKRDDGAVVYINGTERFRTNLPTGTIDYKTKAPSAASDGGNTAQTVTLPANNFVNGNNVIAVELHQQASSSADLSFDLELRGTAAANPAPSVTSIARQVPVNETTNAATVTFRIIFSQAVTGVNLPDFTLTKTGSATGTLNAVATVNATTYDVSVNGVGGSGTLRLDLNASGTGIVNASSVPISGGYTTGQIYTIQAVGDPAPSVVSIVRQSPTTQSTSVNTLVYRITFSENVNGVNAADFTTTVVSGTVSAAISNLVSVGGNNIYDITLNPVTGNGTIRLDLNAAGTGITDAAGNSITGGFTTGETFIINQTAPPSNPLILIPYNSEWKYLDNGSNQNTAWRASTFNDATWKTGPAQLGYGQGDEATVVSYGPDSDKRYLTTYFRKTISIANAADYTNFTLNVKRDDGAVVYINGTERYRTNLPTGTIDYKTKAPSAASDNGNTAQTITLPSNNFVNGSNVIAVELHQQASSSADLSFDLELRGTAAANPAPVINSINRQVPTTQITAATTVIFRATFSESVSGVDAPDFTLATVSGTATGTVSTITPVSGTNNSSYDVTVSSITGTGELRLNLNATGTGIVDAAGASITGGFSTGQTFTIQAADQTPPSITGINRQVPTTQSTSAASVIFRVVFSETVSGVDAADFSLTTVNGSATGTISTITPVSGTNNSSYDVTVNSITGSGELRLDLNASGTGIADAAGNPIGGGFITGQTYNIQPADITAPAVTGINRQAPSTQTTGAASVTFRALFSETVSGVDAADFSLTTVNGTATGTVSTVTPVSGTNNSSYDVTVNSITGSGEIRLNLIATGTGIVDAAGNPISGGFTTGQTYNIQPADITAPAVISINRQDPTTQITGATSVTFRAVFSETVSGVDAADFSLTTVNGTATGTVSSITPVSGMNNSSYDVTVNSITGSGEIRLNLIATGTGIVDAAGNPISGGFTTGQTYNIQPHDVTPPAVNSINRQAPTSQLTTASSVIFRVNFSETVSGVDAPDFSLTVTGSATGSITGIAPVSGSTSSFDVTVGSLTGSGDIRLDLNASGTGIVDAANNPIGGGFITGQIFTIQPADVTPPSINEINRQVPTTQITSAASVTFRAIFSETVSGVNSTDFSLITVNGSATGTVSSVTAVSGSTNSMYDITVNSVTGSGELRLDLLATGTGIVDGANNAITGGFTTGQTFIIQPADQTAPSVTSINRQSPPSQITSLSSVIYRVTFSEAVSGVDAADFSLTVTGTASGSISSLAPVINSNNSYDVTVGSLTGSGNIRLDLNASGTGIVDAASNPITGGFITGQVYTIQPPDQTPPAVNSIARLTPGTAMVTTTSVTFRATFSESVSGVGVSDFTLTTVSGSVTGTISSVTPFAGSNNSIYDITVNALTGNGDFRLDLNATNTGIVDAANNPISGGFNTGETYTLQPEDQTPPSVTSINRFLPTTEITSATSVTYKASFSEPVTGVGISDFTVTTISGDATGTVSGVVSVTGSNNSIYEVTVNALTGSGVIRLDLKSTGTGIADAVSNPISGGFENGQTYTIQPADQTPPSVTSINRYLPLTQNSIGTSVTFRIVFSETVTGADASDFTLTTISGTVTGNIAGVVPVANTNTSSYDVTVSGLTGSGDIRLDLNATGTGILDVANNTIVDGFTAGETYTIQTDQTPPDVNSINRQSPTTQTTNTTTVTFRAIFSETVTGVGASDFNLSTVSGSATGVVSGVTVVASTNNTTYDIIVNSITGSGDIRLDLKSSGTGIQDAAGNAISGGFITGQTYTIQPADQTPPTVTGINRQVPLTQITTATSVTFRANFSESVTGVDPADFVLTAVNGTVSGSISGVALVAGSNNSSYDVTVNVLSGNGDLRLDLIATGTEIVDVANNPLTGGFASGETYTIQPAEPTISTLIPYLSVWKYLDNGTNQNTAWRATSFNDDTWNSGPGKFGYGEGDEGTIVSFGPNASMKYVTTYFRKSITIADASQYKRYTLNLRRDDGAVVYINGTEVYRTNVGTGTVAYNTKATESAADDGAVPQTFILPAGSLVNGTNVIAVEVHQQSNANTDLTFDLELVGTPVSDADPVVSSINRQSPTAQVTSSTFVTFRVVFSEPVTGVDISDFTLTTVSGSTTGMISTVAPVSSSDNSSYDVTVNALSGGGNIRLDLKATGTNISDAGYNPINSGFNTGQVYTFEPGEAGPGVSGFTTLTPLTPLPIAVHTGDKPQAKVFKFAGKHWCILISTTGTNLWRLDGTSWTNILRLSTSKSGHPDVRVVGDSVVHVLLEKNDKAELYSVQYLPATNTFKLWDRRPAKSTVEFPDDAETTTLEVDGTGRMWVVTDGPSTINVQWSDAPYSSWSAPINIASGITDDDLGTVVYLPGKIGVFWGNQNTKRFGFRTHNDGDAPNVWSADEVPASQSALNLGYGMADDHMNLVVSSTGILYCAVKTGYDTPGQPKVSLLVRRPNGIWDPLYPVTTSEGTRPIALLNEALGKITLVYTSLEGGGDIMYRVSSTSNISFGAPTYVAIGNYNYSTSTHQTYDPDIVFLVTNLGSSSLEAAGWLAIDGTSSPATGSTTTSTQAKATETVAAEAIAVEPALKEFRFFAYPNPFRNTASIRFSLPETGKYTMTLYDLKGASVSQIKEGWAEAGTQQTVQIDGSKLINGLYILRLQTKKNAKTIKLILNR